MKPLLILHFIFLSTFLFAQQEAKPPTISYVSAWELEDLLAFHVGYKILFRQNCTMNAPENVVNGTVYFENVRSKNHKLQVQLEFKDTVVHSILYHFKSKDHEVKEKLGFGDISFTKKQGKAWILFTIQENYSVYVSKQGNKIKIMKIKGN